MAKRDESQPPSLFDNLDMFAAEPADAEKTSPPQPVDATPSSRQKRMTTWGLSPLPISRVRSSSSRKNARWATRLIR